MNSGSINKVDEVSNEQTDSETGTVQPRPQVLDMLAFHLYENNFLLEEIDKIIKKRWRVIGHTTRYGWLAAFSYNRRISQEDARILSALANKVGFENCGDAIERIQALSEHLHPTDIPGVAIAVLNETHTSLMLRQRRGSKSNIKSVKDQFPTIFTIFGASCSKRQ